MEESQRTRLREAFRDLLTLPSGLEPRLRQALAQVLANHGSLIRPEILFELALGYRIPEELALRMAVALEYFHTASLLCDDLPAMDDAVERRGAACVHIEFGESVAILAALALINRAYALLWKAVGWAPPDRRQRALDYVECHLGVEGLLNGQSLDLHYAELPQDRPTAERIAIAKTVSLVRLTLVLPALVGGAPEAEVRFLERTALFWGLSYQILDDLKDVLQSPGESGKTTSRDLLLGRPNLALVLGIAGAEQRLQRLIALGDRTVDRLVAIRPGTAFLRARRAELAEEAVHLTRWAAETVR